MREREWSGVRENLREGGRGVVEKEIVKGEGKRGGEIKKHKGWRVRKEIKTSNKKGKDYVLRV